MKKLIALYYLHKCKKANPQWRILLTKSKSSNSYYIIRKKNGVSKDKVRVSDHPVLNRHKHACSVRTTWKTIKLLHLYIDIRKTIIEVDK